MKAHNVTSWLLVLGLAMTLGPGIAQTRSRAQTVHRTISAVTAHQYWQYHKQTQFKYFGIIDLRPAAAFARGHIEGAKNIPFTKQITSKLSRLDRRKAYMIYSKAGRKAVKVLQMMKKLHFREVYNIQDGIIGWKRRGYPITR